MKTLFKLIFKTILLLIGMLAFCLLVGEPDPEAHMSLGTFILIKAGSVFTIWGCVKLAMIADPELRKQIESEEIV